MFKNNKVFEFAITFYNILHKVIFKSKCIYIPLKNRLVCCSKYIIFNFKKFKMDLTITILPLLLWTFHCHYFIMLSKNFPTTISFYEDCSNTCICGKKKKKRKEINVPIAMHKKKIHWGKTCMKLRMIIKYISVHIQFSERPFL